MAEPILTCPRCGQQTRVEALAHPARLRVTMTVCDTCGWDDLPRLRRKSPGVRTAVSSVRAANAAPGPERDRLSAVLCQSRSTVHAFPRPAKAQIAHRDGGLCVRCGLAIVVLEDDGRWHAVRPGEAHFHHRQAKGMGGRSVDHTPTNGVLLCPACHAWVHANPADGALLGLIVSWTDSPETVPVAVALGPGETARFGLDDDRRVRIDECERCGDDAELHRVDDELLCRRCRRELTTGGAE